MKRKDYRTGARERDIADIVTKSDGLLKTANTLSDRFVEGVLRVMAGCGVVPPNVEVAMVREGLRNATNETLDGMVASIDRMVDRARVAALGSDDLEKRKKIMMQAWRELMAKGEQINAMETFEGLGMSVAMTRMPKYKNDKEFADECVTAFLACSESVMAQARGNAAGYDGIDAERAQQNARRAWTGMQRARLFMIRPETWVSLYNAADRFATQAVGGRWAEYDASNPPDPDEVDRLVAFYQNEGRTWAFPDPMPFEACFFAYGKRLAIGGNAVTARLRDRRLQDRDVRLIGNLLVWEGDQPYAYTFLRIDRLDSDSDMGLLVTYENGEWFQPDGLDPWILSSIVRSINDKSAAVQDYAPTLSNRLDRKKAEKQARQQLPLPAPYYLINLKDELITPQQMAQHRVGKTGRLVEWSHRWDVRGHEAMRYQLGSSPMDEKLRAKLVKRGYRIYENRAVSAQDSERLGKRGVRYVPNEETWIAVLSYWQPPCVKGPPDRPYVPGARI